MKEYKMPTTKEEYIAEHRKMWNWIADESIKNHCKKNKLQYLRHIGVDPKSINTKCWMCDYACKQTDDIEIVCEYCPLEWEKVNGEKVPYCCAYDDSLYYSFCSCSYKNYEYAAEIARRIANLPSK